MPYLKFNKIEITERVMPAFFILIGIKFALFDIIPNVPAYANAVYLPESVWAAIFLATGLLQFAATLLDRHKFRCGMLLASASLWILWAGMIIYSRSSGFGSIIWTLIAVQCFWTYYRVRHSPVK